MDALAIVKRLIALSGMDARRTLPRKKILDLLLGLKTKESGSEQKKSDAMATGFPVGESRRQPSMHRACLLGREGGTSSAVGLLVATAS